MAIELTDVEYLMADWAVEQTSRAIMKTDYFPAIMVGPVQNCADNRVQTGTIATTCQNSNTFCRSHLAAFWVVVIVRLLALDSRFSGNGYKLFARHLLLYPTAFKSVRAPGQPRLVFLPDFHYTQGLLEP